VEAEELGDHQRQFVGRSLGVRRDAPVVGQLGAVEQTHNGLRVPDVDG
jgi:hypothetical protein